MLEQVGMSKFKIMWILKCEFYCCFCIFGERHLNIPHQGCIFSQLFESVQRKKTKPFVNIYQICR